MFSLTTGQVNSCCAVAKMMGAREMERVFEKISKLKMAVRTQTRKVFPLNHFNIIKNLSIDVKNSKVCNVTKKLDQLEERLDDFDAELTYAKIHSDLTEKYDLTRPYYKAIEAIRQELYEQGELTKETCGKRELVQRLDETVTSLRTDFSKCAEEKYKLLDEIFLIRTNSHIKFDINELSAKVDKFFDGPGDVYANEFDKIIKIYDILEEEENRLMKIKLQKKK